MRSRYLHAGAGVEGVDEGREVEPWVGGGLDPADYPVAATAAEAPAFGLVQDVEDLAEEQLVALAAVIFRTLANRGDSDAALHRHDWLIGPRRQNPLQLQGGDAVQNEGGLRVVGGKWDQKAGLASLSDLSSSGERRSR